MIGSEIEMSLKAQIPKSWQLIRRKSRTFQKCPLYTSTISAGFPSPAEDSIDMRLDLNEHLIKHPAATFFLRVAGDSMLGEGIHPGDLLIVDRSIEAVHGKVVIAAVDGQLTVKKLYKKEGKISLVPANKAYKHIMINEEQDLIIWGVVTNVLHAL